MTVRVTVIGSAGTHASAERVCSSYLVSHNDTHLLLDMGSGALHNLLKVIDVADLDAVLISHLHPDHYLDIFGLNYAWRFHPASPPPLPVYGPAAMYDTVASLLPAESVERMVDLLHFKTATAGDTIDVGPFHVELFAMNHPTETLGSRITVGDTVIAYTGDTAPTPATDLLARDADLLICDATWSEAQRPLPENVHCTAAEAGQAAASAGAKRLLVTHVSPYNDPHALAKEAAEHYDGEVLVAVDLQEILL